jgi:outer membrane protein OmpA-like peptidoglycan-associated protein
MAQPQPAPAQAPAAAPAAPAVPRTYLVFFDFDRSDIRPEARRIIETAAANRKTANVTRLEVTGHADRSGPDRYNERLSMRRAEMVRAELVRLGVPENEIAIFAKGEREPLVQTADGVREPQNRRVEIVLK